MIEKEKGGTISVRKYKKETDLVINIIKGIKWNEELRKKHKLGKSYSIYISKEKIKEMKNLISKQTDEEKKGGFLPLLPLILAGIGAATGIGGVATGIAKTVIDSNAKKAELEEQKRFNDEIIKTQKSGEAISLRVREPWKNGSSLGVKEFFNKSKLDDIGRKTSRSYNKNLHDNFDISYDGSALTLRHY
jgi:hypothetical protein